MAQEIKIVEAKGNDANYLVIDPTTDAPIAFISFFEVPARPPETHGDDCVRFYVDIARISDE